MAPWCYTIIYPHRHHHSNAPRLTIHYHGAHLAAAAVPIAFTVRFETLLLNVIGGELSSSAEDFLGLDEE